VSLEDNAKKVHDIIKRFGHIKRRTIDPTLLTMYIDGVFEEWYPKYD